MSPRSLSCVLPLPHPMPNVLGQARVCVCSGILPPFRAGIDPQMKADIGASRRGTTAFPVSQVVLISHTQCQHILCGCRGQRRPIDIMITIINNIIFIFRELV